MKPKHRAALTIGLITVVSIIDYQLFSEVVSARAVPPFVRQAMHLVFLACLVPIGYFSLKKDYPLWAPRMWLTGYLLVIGMLILVGVVQMKFGLLGIKLLDGVSTIRQFFTSPLPYLAIVLLKSRFQYNER